MAKPAIKRASLDNLTPPDLEALWLALRVHERHAPFDPAKQSGRRRLRLMARLRRLLESMGDYSCTPPDELP